MANDLDLSAVSPPKTTCSENRPRKTEYMDTRRTKITVYGVPVNICEDRMGAFFSKYGQMRVVVS